MRSTPERSTQVAFLSGQIRWSQSRLLCAHPYYWRGRTCGWTSLCEDRARLASELPPSSRRTQAPTLWTGGSMYGRRETGDKEVYGWQMVGQPSHTRGHVATDLANPSHASSRLRFPSPRCPLMLCQRLQARQKWESFRHVVCMPVCGVARQPQGLCLGRVASCLISTAYPPAMYVPLDLQYTTAGVQAGVLTTGCCCCACVCPS